MFEPIISLEKREEKIVHVERSGDVKRWGREMERCDDYYTQKINFPVNYEMGRTENTKLVNLVGPNSVFVDA